MNVHDQVERIFKKTLGFDEVSVKDLGSYFDGLSKAEPIIISTSWSFEFGFSIIKALPIYEGLKRQGFKVEPLFLRLPNVYRTSFPERGFFKNLAEALRIRMSKRGKLVDLTHLNHEYFYPAMKDPKNKKYFQYPSFKITSSPEDYFKKPLLVITNKYNSEPSKHESLTGVCANKAVQFIPLGTLEKIFLAYRDKYQIIYNRYDQKCDRSQILQFGDFDLIRNKYPQVIILQDFAKKHAKSHDRMQLEIYDQCERYICAQGGGSYLCFFFGGKSVIFHNMPNSLYEDVVAKRRRFTGCTEITPGLDSYQSVFPEISGQEILYERSLNDFEKVVLGAF